MIQFFMKLSQIILSNKGRALMQHNASLQSCPSQVEGMLLDVKSYIAGSLTSMKEFMKHVIGTNKTYLSR